MSKEATQGGSQHPLTLGSSISAKQNPSSFKQDSRHFPVVWAGLVTGFVFAQFKVSRTWGSPTPPHHPSLPERTPCSREQMGLQEAILSPGSLLGCATLIESVRHRASSNRPLRPFSSVFPQLLPYPALRDGFPGTLMPGSR